MQPNSTTHQPVGVPALNALAAATLWGALLGPIFYPLGASLGLWPALTRLNGTCGDDPADFTMVGTGAALGLLVGGAVVAWQLRRGRGHAFGAVAVDLLRFYLALTLLGYGLSKVWATQFVNLWANLDTPPSELNPMRVAWMFFGYSQPYQQFLGWAEVVPALLLLPRRTATLGALLTITVMANVFALNVFFDICVKLQSGLYLASALLIFLQDTRRLWQFFFGNGPVPPRRVATDWFESRPGRRRFRSLTLVIVALVLVLAGLDAQGVYQYAQSQRPTPLTGVWQPRRAERWVAGRWQPLAPADSAYPTRFYLQAGQVVIRNVARRDRFTCDEDSTKRELKLTQRTDRNGFLPPVHWRYQPRTHRDSLHLLGRWHRDSLRLSLGLVRR